MWLSFKIEDKEYFLMKFHTDDCLQISLTDLIYLWKGSQTNNELIEAIQKENDDIGINNNYLIEMTNNFFQINEKDNTQQIEKLENGNLLLTLKKKSLKIELKYKISLTKSTAEEFSREVTLPFMILVQDFKNRAKHLEDLVLAKDVELNEFKLEGFKISRKGVSTKYFKSEEFRNNFNGNILKTAQQAMNNLNQIFTDDVNILYPNILKVTNNTLPELEMPNEEPIVTVNEVTSKRDNSVFKTSEKKTETAYIPRKKRAKINNFKI